MNAPDVNDPIYRAHQAEIARGNEAIKKAEALWLAQPPAVRAAALEKAMRAMGVTVERVEQVNTDANEGGGA